MEIGLTMMGGDPNALYSRPRADQAQILGWWAATRFPAGWRAPKRPRRKGVKVDGAEAERFWFGGG